MAIALDASTPLRFTGTPINGGTVVSASFTPPANSFLVLCIEGDGDTTNFGTVTNTPTTATLTWTNKVERTTAETTVGGMSAIWTCPQVTSAARTITITNAHNLNPTTVLRVSGKVYVFTGVDISGTPVDTVTASNEGGSATTPLTTTSITPGANGVLVSAVTDWNIKGAITSSDMTASSGPDHAEYAGAIDVADGYKAVTSGVAATATWTAGAAGPQWKWVQIIVRESAAASTDTSEWRGCYPTPRRGSNNVGY